LHFAPYSKSFEEVVTAQTLPADGGGASATGNGDSRAGAGRLSATGGSGLIYGGSEKQTRGNTRIYPFYAIEEMLDK